MFLQVKEVALNTNYIVSVHFHQEDSEMDIPHAHIFTFVSIGKHPEWILSGDAYTSFLDWWKTQEVYELGVRDTTNLARSDRGLTEV